MWAFIPADRIYRLAKEFQRIWFYQKKIPRPILVGYNHSKILCHQLQIVWRLIGVKCEEINAGVACCVKPYRFKVGQCYGNKLITTTMADRY